MNETTTDHVAEKNRSYDVRVQRGQRVRLLRDVRAARRSGESIAIDSHTTIPAGTVITVASESNAGFRGIEMFAYVGDAYCLHVSTGAVEHVS